MSEKLTAKQKRARVIEITQDGEGVVDEQILKYCFASGYYIGVVCGAFVLSMTYLLVSLLSGRFL